MRLRRGALRAAAIAAAALVASVATSPADARPPLSASTSLAPRPAFFGGRVTARAEIVVDKTVVDPASVRFTPDFTPYAAVGAPARSRADAGSVTTLGFVYTLACLDDGCLPGTSIRAVTLAPATVDAQQRDGRAITLPVRWQPLLVAPRVTPAAASTPTPTWRIQLALPAVTYRVRPATATAFAWLLAAGCAIAGVALVAWELVRRRRIAQARARALSQLAAAIALVRESQERAADDRRRALALLSRVLATHGNGEAHLADDATRLAWDRPDPSRASIEDLLRDVEATLVSK